MRMKISAYSSDLRCFLSRHGRPCLATSFYHLFLTCFNYYAPKFSLCYNFAQIILFLYCLQYVRGVCTPEFNKMQHQDLFELLGKLNFYRKYIRIIRNIDCMRIENKLNKSSEIQRLCTQMAS